MVISESKTDWPTLVPATTGDDDEYEQAGSLPLDENVQQVGLKNLNSNIGDDNNPGSDPEGNGDAIIDDFVAHVAFGELNRAIDKKSHLMLSDGSSVNHHICTCVQWSHNWIIIMIVLISTFIHLLTANDTHLLAV